MNKKFTITAKDSNGRKESWRFWHDGAFWFLQGPDAYVRTLEKTWRDSVPRIHSILENYGLAAEVS